jgi:isopenicillin N synthase-like dioxygenase
VLEDFEFRCDEICRRILSTLSGSLQAQGHTTAFTKSHRTSELSTTTLGVLKYSRSSDLDSQQFGHMAHTDVGSLTLLFPSSPGLEILCDDQWVSVPPLDGHIVVIVGDTLSFMSELQFKSCVHRVILPRSAGQSLPRFSVAFFKRPELSAKFRDGTGREWTAVDWHLTKYKIFRAANEEQERTSLLTGMKGFLGHV